MRDKRYQAEAYLFVFEALQYAQEVLGLGASDPDPEPALDDEEVQVEKHVSGQELCGAIREYAIEQFGLMALTVLHQWGIRQTDDFGEIVFNLIEIGQMRKTENDRKEDFQNVFDFEEGFRRSFEITVKQESRETKP